MAAVATKVQLDFFGFLTWPNFAFCMLHAVVQQKYIEKMFFQQGLSLPRKKARIKEEGQQQFSSSKTEAAKT